MSESLKNSADTSYDHSWDNMETLRSPEEIDEDIRREIEKLNDTRQKLKELKSFEPATPEEQEKEIKEFQQKEIALAQEKEVEKAQFTEAQTKQIEEEMKAQSEETAKNVQEIMEAKASDEEINALEEEIKEIRRQLKQLDVERAAIQKPQESTELVEVPQTKAEVVEKPKVPEKTEIVEKPKTPENPEPLVAVNVDWTHDKHEMARDLAEQTLNAEVAKGKIIQKLWKGTLFKKYYEKKYEKEFFKGERTTEDGKTVNDLLREQKPAVMERFVLGAVEDMKHGDSSGFVHEKIGKERKDGTYDGEKLIPADEKTNEQIKSVIEDYARRHLEAGEKVSDLDREFRDNMERVLREAIDDGRMSSGSKDSNYLEVAKAAAERYAEVAVNARNKAEHDAAMAQVMAGFQAYNAEARSNVRTEAHRDAIDKIVNAIESSKIGQFIPAEIIAGAVGVGFGLTQTGARAILGAAGGIIASGAISGLKERNRITEDRARMQRDIANGMDYGSDNKRSAKYEQRIGGTLYDLQKASDLTSRINEAFDPENETTNLEKLQAIAEARVRIDFSDSEQKDLIGYSSPDKRGKERLDLDIAVIKAEKSLSEEDKKLLKILKDDIQRKIVEGYEDESGEHHAGVEEKDKDFKNFRAIAAAKKAGKTLALGAAVFFGSQEVMAMIDPNKIGVLEKAGIVKTDNAKEAQETLLARLGGRGEYSITSSSTSNIENVSDPNEVARFEANGYTKTETAPAWSEPKSTITEVDPSASTARVDVKYDGWANNGTKVSDGNELRAYIENGTFVSKMRGASTLNGKALEYDPSRMKGYITIGNSKFEIAGKLNDAGQLTWGENGVFTTTTGETIKAIGDNGEKLYKYFEIAMDNGVDADGVQHIIPFATDVGKNTFADKITQVVESTIEHPATYTLSKTIETSETFVRGVTTAGIGFAPETARVGLGAARVSEEAPGFQPPATVGQQSTEVQPTVIQMPGPVASEEELRSQQQPPAVIEMPGPVAESAESGSAESDRINEQLHREIENNKALIGGDQGVYFLTNHEGLTNLGRAAYNGWWNSLSDYGKQFVRHIIAESKPSDKHTSPDWGRGFRDWYGEQEAA